MTDSLRIVELPSAALSSMDRDALVALCTAAYEEPFAPYFDDIGPGVHLLGYVGDTLVSHVMWVDRAFYVGDRTLHGAYVEAVATLPSEQGRGYASTLMRAVTPLLASHEIALLSPSEEGFYARFGWARWHGPLSYRDAGAVVETPDEEVMYLRLPRTPADLDDRAPMACDWRPGEVW